ncbi:MAG: hypothetical protein K2J37_02190 [Ruminococcus sp.]|nr:hypothetical protein [Ruminococcus sp.]
MTKNAKITAAVSVSAAVILAAAAAAGIIVCSRIYKKEYYSADRINAFC